MQSQACQMGRGLTRQKLRRPRCCRALPDPQQRPSRSTSPRTYRIGRDVLIASKPRARRKHTSANRSARTSTRWAILCVRYRWTIEFFVSSQIGASGRRQVLKTDGEPAMLALQRAIAQKRPAAPSPRTHHATIQRVRARRQSKMSPDTPGHGRLPLKPIS